MPSEAVINGFRGSIDYYVYRGINCVRMWPRKKRLPPTQAESAHWPAFSDAVAEWNALSPTVRDAYISMASGSTLSGRDIMIKMYINGKSVLPY
jgi:hypothetical protein